MTLRSGDPTTRVSNDGSYPLTEASPTLDATANAWVGVFPGLGSISVDDRGDVVVSPYGDANDDPTILLQRERALLWGWAEPLSWLRRGYHLIDGIALGHPDEESCIVVSGDYHDSSRLVVNLIADGWLLISDRPSPYSWVGDDLIAAPREAPFLIARRRAIKAGLEHQSVRADSDSVEVQAPRLTQERKVVAFVSVGARRPFEENLEMLSGHKAFRYATGLLLARPRLLNDTDDEASVPSADEHVQDLQQALKLVKIPMLRLRRTPGQTDTGVEDLTAWWNGRRS